MYRYLKLKAFFNSIQFNSIQFNHVSYRQTTRTDFHELLEELRNGGCLFIFTNSSLMTLMKIKNTNENSIFIIYIYICEVPRKKSPEKAGSHSIIYTVMSCHYYVNTCHYQTIWRVNGTKIVFVRALVASTVMYAKFFV